MSSALISDIQLFKYKVPLHTPFKTAVREVSDICDIIVQITSSDGLCAYGSAPSTPLITGDDHQSIERAITNKLKGMLVNQALSQIDSLIEEIADLDTSYAPSSTTEISVGSNTKAAIDIALHDLKARRDKLPLYRLLSPPSLLSLNNLSSEAPILKTDYTISVNSVDTMCKDIDKALKRGYTCLKIKIGNTPSEDLARIRAIYAHIQARYKNDKEGTPINLRLDVNQGWDAKTTINIMQILESEGIAFELIEQPVKANDTEGLRLIKANINTPVMADESAFSLTQVEALIQQNVVDIINIKLMKTGGIYQASAIAQYCREHNIPCMMGCMLEGSIGVAAAAHFAYANRDVVSLIDLDGPTLGQFDPVIGATEFDNANITLNTTYGLGITKEHLFAPWTNK
uniref:dipeptide epimerase n=1 Tax=Ningiella ruwaisensis TaxID=2364274 RepID=UPI00109FCE84|nr:dipeptide epimerase [Ningiella ruwaisensis]